MLSVHDLEDIRRDKVLTLSDLGKMEACLGGMLDFVKAFPKGIAKLTKASFKKAKKAKMDLEWLVEELVGDCADYLIKTTPEYEALRDKATELEVKEWSEDITDKQYDKLDARIYKLYNKMEALHNDPEWLVIQAWLSGNDEEAV